MASKNFLDQFSTNNKPDSFKEEVLVPASKPKKPLNITVLIVLAVFVVIGGFSLWFFLLRPTIEVPSFIGLEISDVNSWVKQQGIQPAGIVIKDEYSEDYDAKKIIFQSVEEGKKVKKDVKIDFTISLGPDPNVAVVVPDISSMTLPDINTWISSNKLTGVKISYEFSDEDPVDSVITYEFGSDASEANFKRNSTLKITVSKGNQADQPISVPNFNNKNYTDVTNWGSKNKIKIIKREEYSNTVNKDVVIEQSVNPGKKITSKESLTVTISKGAPIIAPDFSSYSEANILAWGTKNLVNIEIIRKYSKDVAKDKVIDQSIKGKACNDGMSVTISLGNISSSDFTGTTLDELNKWIEDVNRNGAGLSLGSRNYVNDDSVPANNIISISSVEVGSSINVNISEGKNIFLVDGTETSWSDACAEYNKTEAEVRKLCEDNSGLSCKFSYIKDETGIIGRVKSIKRGDTNEDPTAGSYISQIVNVNITVCESN